MFKEFREIEEKEPPHSLTALPHYERKMGWFDSRIKVRTLFFCRMEFNWVQFAKQI